MVIFDAEADGHRCARDSCSWSACVCPFAAEEGIAGVAQEGISKYATLSGGFEKMYAHEKALLEMGFLAKREVPLNGDFTAVFKEFENKNAIERYARVRVPMDYLGDDVSVFVFTVPTNDLPKWEEFIRKIAAQQSGK
jgi:hypothetical protein